MSGPEAGAVEAVAGLVRAAEVGWTQVPGSWATASPNSNDFASFIAHGVNKVNATMVRADAALSQTALDGTQPPHQVMLALEEARLTFQLALQVRNRLLEGYQEMMRMQV
jgi:flagellar hook-basal body complex protein FliE